MVRDGRELRRPALRHEAPARQPDANVFVLELEVAHVALL
jgi:hypothetical protein